MNKHRWLAVALLALIGAASAADVLILERNGPSAVLREGHVVVWDYSSGVMLLEYSTDRLFGDGFE